jgi:predicted nucleotidyltransferase
MAQTAPELEQIIQRFRKQLEKMQIRVEQILLFGSQADGTAQEGSDIDLIVISKDWEKFSRRERLELLGVAAARILEPVRAQGFTQAEISRRQTTLFWEEIIKDQAVGPSDRKVNCGAAVQAMVLNGLGFTRRAQCDFPHPFQKADP